MKRRHGTVLERAHRPDAIHNWRQTTRCTRPQHWTILLLSRLILHEQIYDLTIDVCICMTQSGMWRHAASGQVSFIGAWLIVFWPYIGVICTIDVTYMIVKSCFEIWHMHIHIWHIVSNLLIEIYNNYMPPLSLTFVWLDMLSYMQCWCWRTKPSLHWLGTRDVVIRYSWCSLWDVWAMEVYWRHRFLVVSVLWRLDNSASGTL
jgi:hypothetical protein